MPTRTCRIIATLAGATLWAPGARAQAPRANPGAWTEIAIKSATLGGERKVYVVSPSDTTQRPAVLVLLDADDRPQFESAIANIHFLETRRAILPLLIVGIPNGKDRTHDLTPPASGPTAKQFPTAGGADRFADFISNEVLPAVRSRYRTLPYTIIAGHSFGGLFVAHIAATRPGAFPAAIAMSPSLWWNDSTSVAPYAGDAARNSAPLRLFVTSGAFEPPIDNTARRFVALLDSLHPAALAYQYHRYPADSHGLTPLPSLVDGLQFIFEPISLATTPITMLDLSADSATIMSAFRQTERAYDAGARAIGIDPTLPQAFVGATGMLILTYFHKPRVATEVLQANVERHPQSASTHDNLGDALLATGDTAAARAQYHAAVDLASHAHDHGLRAMTDKLKKLEPVAQAGAPKL